MQEEALWAYGYTPTLIELLTLTTVTQVKRMIPYKPQHFLFREDTLYEGNVAHSQVSYYVKH